MKIASLAESPADSHFILGLTENVIERTAIAYEHSSFRAQGWPSVLNVAPALLRHLHFSTDVEGLIVLADGNSSPLHTPTHRSDPQCRYCALTGMLGATSSTLPAVGHRESPPKIAVAIAYPAIEAWFLVGRDPHIGEMNLPSLYPGMTPASVRRKLKFQVYGTERPVGAQCLETAASQRAALNQSLPELIQRFPSGLGNFVSEIRGW
jgi:hypothetical protein